MNYESFLSDAPKLITDEMDEEMEESDDYLPGSVTVLFFTPSPPHSFHERDTDLVEGMKEKARSDWTLLPRRRTVHLSRSIERRLIKKTLDFMNPGSVTNAMDFPFLIHFVLRHSTEKEAFFSQLLHFRDHINLNFWR
ncbi:hypothetical protein CAEBREN_18108 [Caenorhabditis brenneri]|uniref:Uncharacterized protein n=1 Tax=Caenorhabditis brenneri TaxID=135651 RepID=G0P1Q7_CAEBE|nr:hypothetical protein CAEBREN_18108 [Caenorhabditis brenneri]